MAHVCLSLCRIAVYKALYRIFGGFVADVVAAIDQVLYISKKMMGPLFWLFKFNSDLFHTKHQFPLMT